jgi:hypothetical protein
MNWNTPLIISAPPVYGLVRVQEWVHPLDDHGTVNWLVAPNDKKTGDCPTVRAASFLCRAARPSAKLTVTFGAPAVLATTD